MKKGLYNGNAFPNWTANNRNFIVAPESRFDGMTTMSDRYCCPKTSPGRFFIPVRIPLAPGKAFIFAIVLVFLHVFTSVCVAFEDDNWTTILRMYRELISRSVTEIRELETKLTKSSIVEYRKDLSKLEKERGQLMLWFGTNADPWDIRDAIRGIGTLKNETAKLIVPFREHLRSIRILDSLIRELSVELNRQLQTAESPEHKTLIAEDILTLDTLGAETVRFRNILETEISRGEHFLERLDRISSDLKAKTTEIWEYYLTAPPHLASPDLWKSLSHNMEKVAGYYSDFFGILRREAAGDKFLSFLVKIFLLWLGIAALFYAAAARLFRQRLDRDVFLLLCTCWFVISPGILLIILIGDVPFLLYPLTHQLTEIFFFAGLLAFAYFLTAVDRRHSNPRTDFQVLLALILLIIYEIIFQMFSIPYVIGGTIWTVILLIVSFTFFRKAKGSPSGNTKMSFSLAAVFFFVLAAASFSGYLYMSFLVVSAVFSLMIISVSCAATFRVFRRIEKAAVSRQLPPVIFGILEGFFLPLLTAGYFLLNLWLFFSQVGADSLFGEFLSREMMIGTVTLSVNRVMVLFVFFFLAKSVIYATDSLIAGMHASRSGTEREATETLKTLSRYAFWGSYLVGALIFLNFSFTSIAVVLGGLSVGIGFGLQHIVNNFFSGMILLFGRAIRPGDVIQLGKMQARVRKVTIRNTVVQTRDNATIFIPNAELLSQQLMNWSHTDRSVRIDINVGVAYGSNIRKVKHLLLQAAKGHQEVLDSPSPVVLLWNFGADALEYRLRFWIKNVDADTAVMSDVRGKVEELFRENGVEMAFPQRDLHIRTMPDDNAALPGMNFRGKKKMRRWRSRKRKGSGFGF